MTDRDAIEESLNRADDAMNKLRRKLHTYRYDQVRSGYLTKELGDDVLQILKCQQESIILIERDLDDRLRKLEGE